MEGKISCGFCAQKFEVLKDHLFVKIRQPQDASGNKILAKNGCMRVVVCRKASNGKLEIWNTTHSPCDHSSVAHNGTKI